MAQKRWRQEQKDIAIRQGRAYVTRVWRKHRSVRLFLQDYFPRTEELVRTCSRGFKVYVDQMEPNFIKLNPIRCGKVPFCVICSRVSHWRRMNRVLDRFGKCTPKGKEPRFIHMVQTAPFGREGQYAEGGDWGRKASEDTAKFGKIVWQTIEDFYGEGMGAVMSYQDFGEQGFAKRHPHMDLTINGWAIRDGKAVPVDAYAMRGRGRSKWLERVRHYAQSFEIGAEIGHVHSSNVVVGKRAYVKAIEYQTREMVDFTSIRYSRQDRALYWLDDYSTVRRTKIPVEDFLDALHDYQRRLGAWLNKSQGGRSLTRSYGHMADRSIKKTRKLVGGQPFQHPKRCVCAQCGDWALQELAQADAYRADPASMAASF